MIIFFANFSAAPLEVIPLHVRGGIIFPLQSEVGRNTGDTRQNPRALLVALDDANEAQGVLYDDDGESIAGASAAGPQLLVYYKASKGLVAATVARATWRPQGAAAYIQTIDVVGLRLSASAVTSVLVDGQPATFSYDAVRGWLKVRGLAVDVTKDFHLKYH